jgi:hypothetical protein
VDGSTNPLWRPVRGLVAPLCTAANSSAGDSTHSPTCGGTSQASHAVAVNANSSDDSTSDKDAEEVAGCGSDAVVDLKWLLRQCESRGVRVLLSLWSHDLLAVRR